MTAIGRSIPLTYLLAVCLLASGVIGSSLVLDHSATALTEQNRQLQAANEALRAELAE